MAAGGSMPELFTSFLATFRESEVGFVAIVGSAVFNVLFVIAVCAIASEDVLTLTWWPLARDCSWYVLALLTVAILFGVTTPNAISWIEACILLLEYIGYCTFMKFNGKIHHWVESKFKKSKVADASSPSSRQSEASTEIPNTNFLKPSQFRAGIVQLLTRNAYLYETAGIAAVTQIKGELEDTFKRLDKDKDGKINVNEVGELLESLGVKSDSGAIKTAIRRINRSGDEEITFESFKKWYLSSEARIEAEIHHVFDKFDTNKNGTIEVDEITACLKSLGHKPTSDEVKQLMEELISSTPATSMQHGDGPPAQPDVTCVANIGDMVAEVAKEEQKIQTPSSASVTLEQFEAWYKNSMFYQGKQKENEMCADEEESGALSLDMPDGASKVGLFWYFFTYPLCALLYCTLPDVRTPKLQRNAKMAIVEFCLCLVWIGIFSNWLYECLVVVSNTFKIPVAVSAVTLLAGGTSVPDLLSSYVVAKNGEGDMAVSSSIGSNIFDVTVGLPLPWLCYCIYHGKPFALGPSGSKGLGFSILLLIGMLGAVIGTICAMKWRMTKGLGYTMLVFYILYVVQYLLQKLPSHCNVDKVGVFQVNF